MESWAWLVLVIIAVLWVIVSIFANKKNETEEEYGLQRGDVIYVTHKFKLFKFKIPYDHYGVYIGNDGNLKQQVIHFRGKDKEISFSKADIIQTSLHEFLNGGTLQIQDRNYFGDEYPPFSPEEIVIRAKQKLGREGKTYGLPYHNCEHFANDCRYGRHESEQVKKVIKKTKDVGKKIGKTAVIVGAPFVIKKICGLFSNKNGRT